MSVPYNSRLSYPIQLPFDYTSPDGVLSTAKKAPGCSPEQVSLTYWGIDAKGLASVVISWATCAAILQAPPAMGTCSAGDGVLSGTVSRGLSTAGLTSVVYWGSASGSRGQPTATTNTALGKPTSYVYDYSVNGGLKYASPVLHHVLLQGLVQGQSYKYTIVDNVASATQTQSKMRVLAGFRTGPNPVKGTFKVPGMPSPAATTQLPASPFPVKVGVIGDPGQTENTTHTLRHVMEAKPDLVFVLGDLTYADRPDLPGVAPAGCNMSTSGTFPPRWDTWARLFQPLLSKVPVLTANGNHEIEAQPSRKAPYNTAFTYRSMAYNARWPVPQLGASVAPTPVITGPILPQPGAPASANSSGTPSPGAYTNLYHAAKIPGVATTIWLTSYSPYDINGFSQNSEQMVWLRKTLAEVDRSETPWLVLNWHAPWYNTYEAHFQENECFRQAVEPLLMEHSVDLVFMGHVHAYERTRPVYNFTVDTSGCAPVHITIGDAGNIEGVASNFTSPITCPTSNPKFPSYQPQACIRTFQGPGSGCADDTTCTCFTTQPSWSAYREPSFGHGELVFESATVAKWTWFRNEDARSKVSDAVTITRVPSCSRQRRM